MGKKKMDVMKEQEQKFIEGAKETNNVESEQSKKVFDIMLKFAQYGFNRSHSAAYSVVAFHTASYGYLASRVAEACAIEIGEVERATFSDGERYQRIV